MIIDLSHFLSEGRPYWQELEKLLDRLESQYNRKMNIDEVKRFHYLYERTLADLAKIGSFSADPDSKQYLESLTGRAYGEIHDNRRFSVRKFSISQSVALFPQTVRRHVGALLLATAIFAVGCAFGAAATAFDPQAKAVIMPWPHLLQDPSDRVDKEEADKSSSVDGSKISFSSQLMTHNTRVSILSLASGMTCGIGTGILAFYNGVIMGAVSIDYILAGETVFLAAWLLPHGSIEIPAILIAMQAGFVLAGALLGNSRGGRNLRQRFKDAQSDLVILIIGVAAMLVWAGILESFLSQYHSPTVYFAKIAFGVIQLALLVLFLVRFNSKIPDNSVAHVK